VSDARLRAVFNSVAQGGELALDGFIEAVVRLSFHRANPSANPADAAQRQETPAQAIAPPQPPPPPPPPPQPQQPLPGCLERLLREHVLAAAKQDRLRYISPASPLYLSYLSLSRLYLAYISPTSRLISGRPAPDGAPHRRRRRRLAPRARLF